MSLSRLLARLFMVPIGLILALLVAGIFLGFAVLAIQPVEASDPQIHNVFALFSGLFLAGTLGSFAFYPALFVLLFVELLSLRNLWIYLGFGLMLSFFAFHAPGEPVDNLAIALDMRAAAAGLVGGFTYWLVAGRGAGIVKRTLDNRPQNI